MYTNYKIDPDISRNQTKIKATTFGDTYVLSFWQISFWRGIA